MKIKSILKSDYFTREEKEALLGAKVLELIIGRDVNLTNEIRMSIFERRVDESLMRIFNERMEGIRKFRNTSSPER